MAWIGPRTQFLDEWAPYLPAEVVTYLNGAPDCRAIPAGDMVTHEVTPTIAAIEQAQQTKPWRDVRFEAHQQFIDMQWVLTGHERILLAPTAALDNYGTL